MFNLIQIIINQSILLKCLDSSNKFEIEQTYYIEKIIDLFDNFNNENLNLNEMFFNYLQSDKFKFILYLNVNNINTQNKNLSFNWIDLIETLICLKLDKFESLILKNNSSYETDKIIRVINYINALRIELYYS